MRARTGAGGVWKIGGRETGDWKTSARKPAAEATLGEQTVLSEVLAVRTILINLIYDLAAGHAIEPERMRELIAKADAGKVEKALERLKENSSATTNGR